MVRFKVVKGSHVLLSAAIILLITIIAVILLQSGFSGNDTQLKTPNNTEVAYSEATSEAKAVSAFASSTFIPDILKIEILPDQTSLNIAHDPIKVLIYHTHTHEAYAQNDNEPYEAIETWRTLDESYSVVRVGRALADELRNLGCSVTHDTTDHEKDSLNTAYLRSLETLESYIDDQKYFDLYIDLHRDAYTNGINLHTLHNGKEYAQLMLLVGRGDTHSTDEKPDYEKNLAFAQLLTNELNKEIPDICRNITVKQGRYNQHMPGQCILVEVGHNRNTLEQALSSMPCLANSLVSVIKRSS